MAEITLPRLSDSMEEGTILKWLKAPGEHVEAGEELVEIETDKAAMAYAAEEAGTLEIVAPEGATLAVGTLIARLGDGASAPGPASAPATATGTGTGTGTGSEETPASPASPQAAAPDPAPVSTNGHGSVHGNGDGAGGEVAATPLAIRVARAHGVTLSTLTGSGPRGRITRGDVLAAAGIEAAPAPAAPAARASAVSAPASTAAPAPAADGARGVSRTQPMTRRQQVVARRMAEAKATIPEFEVQTEVAMDAALDLRAQLREVSAEDARPSVNDLIIKACAIALTRHPRVNASYGDGAFILHPRVNVGMAVAADGVLVVPTVFDAAERSLGAIARETRRLAERVRSDEITPPELSGATFTVSNLGMFGMTAIHPVINPPQAAILGVGAAREVLARVDGEIVDRTLLTLTLVADHRVFDGADGARFLSEVRGLLERPLSLLV